MGIPQLIRVLEPLAIRTELSGPVVIDGPALAYHVFHICRRGSHRPVGPLDEPSYARLGERVLRWLDALEAYNITVSAIYFDGYLPESKQGERMTRVYEGSRLLNNYYTSTLSGIPASVVTAQDRALGGPSSRTALRQLPLPSFIVPAVLDALRTSDRYARITHLVPGEADPYCAEHVRRCGGIVLTSDSDLLLYDLGENGGVVFLKDLDIQQSTLPSAQENAGDPLKRRAVALTYTKAQMCNKLSLPLDRGLQSLAFEILMDPYHNLSILVDRSLKHEAISAYPEDYERFLAPYVTRPGSLDALPCLDLLDPRVAEIALQTYFIRESSTDQPQKEVYVFLPLLLDGWDRASAWEASTTVRQLAYGVLGALPSSRRVSSMTEFRRTQSKVSNGRPVEVIGPGDLADASKELLATMRAFSNYHGEPEIQWALLSMFQEISHSKDQGKESLVMKAWRQASRSGGKLDATCWDVVHLAAQLQGTFYSLRILQQVLGLHGQGRDELPACLAELKDELSSLPLISGFPTIRTAAGVFERLKAAGQLEVLAEVSGLTEAISLDGPFRDEAKKKRKSKRKRSGRKGGDESQSRKTRAVAGTPRSSNPFDVLADG